DHRQPLLRRNLEAERELAADEMLLAGGIRSYVIIPLIARDRTLGALFLGSPTPNQYSAEDGGFLQAAVQQIASATENTVARDEIGDLPLELQPKLLRVLQEGEFERVGSPQTISVDVRLIAASNRNLEQAIRAGGFRADLYYRLSAFPIPLPPLRDRTEDIALLVRYLTHRYATRLGKRIPSVPAPTMETLQAYAWPGNVRELENVIQRAVIL